MYINTIQYQLIRRILIIIKIILILLFCCGFNLNLSDNDNNKKPGQLFIAGGNIDQNIYNEFGRLINGERLLIINTASPQTQPNLDNFKKAGINDFVVIDDGNIPENCKAVWICGGDQVLLEKKYIGTPVEQKLLNIYRNGGVLGGSSAGASFMSKIMIRGGSVDNLEIGVGLDLLPHCIIDQHFSQRNRRGRLEKAVRSYPGIFGFGIDENTAVVYNGKTIRVIGENSVTVITYMKPEIKKLNTGEILRYENN